MIKKKVETIKTIKAIKLINTIEIINFCSCLFFCQIILNILKIVATRIILYNILPEEKYLFIRVRLTIIINFSPRRRPTCGRWNLDADGLRFSSATFTVVSVGGKTLPEMLYRIT